MKIGDEILLRAKVVDFDSNPHGAAVRVQVIGYDPEICVDSFIHNIRFWVHRLDQPAVIVAKEAA
ncbi:MAG: hypothetical protein FD156_1194 [Nitrospirae bacterium]|nr:MAG: hypothetical protein FD156_1194 [Nitrospirota bacterium]